MTCVNFMLLCVAPVQINDRNAVQFNKMPRLATYVVA